MKKLNFILILLIPLIFMGCNDSKKNNFSAEEEILLEVELERDMTSSHPLDIILKLTNLSDKTVYYNSFYIASNGETLNYFNVSEDDIHKEYKGAMITMAKIGFNSLESGETYRTQASLDKIYEVTKSSHNYKITFLNSMLAKTSDGKTEVMASPEDTGILIKPNELASSDHTSRSINVKSNTLEFEATINEIRTLSLRNKQ